MGQAQPLVTRSEDDEAVPQRGKAEHEVSAEELRSTDHAISQAWSFTGDDGTVGVGINFKDGDNLPPVMKKRPSPTAVVFWDEKNQCLLFSVLSDNHDDSCEPKAAARTSLNDLIEQQFYYYVTDLGITVAGSVVWRYTHVEVANDINAWCDDNGIDFQTTESSVRRWRRAHPKELYT
jgi:hypothetical protein